MTDDEKRVIEEHNAKALRAHYRAQRFPYLFREGPREADGIRPKGMPPFFSKAYDDWLEGRLR